MRNFLNCVDVLNGSRRHLFSSEGVVGGSWNLLGVDGLGCRHNYRSDLRHSSWHYSLNDGALGHCMDGLVDH